MFFVSLGTSRFSEALRPNAVDQLSSITTTALAVVVEVVAAA